MTGLDITGSYLVMAMESRVHNIDGPINNVLDYFKQLREKYPQHKPSEDAAYARFHFMVEQEWPEVFVADTLVNVLEQKESDDNQGDP